MSYMVIIALISLGLCFGSFVNALVWRVHKQSLVSFKKQASSSRYSILKGRSMCVNCRHVLAWYDLLPVVSWVSLNGKCRYCSESISWQYPAVELATASLYVLSYVCWSLSLLSLSGYVLFGLWLILLTGFMALTVYDLRWMLLPDRIVFPLQAIAVMFVLMKFASMPTDSGVVIGAFLGVLCSAGLFYALFVVSSGKWIGGGDVKLAVVLGLVLGGVLESLLMIFIASVLGSVVGIVLIIAKKTKLQGKLPFGPLLMMSTVVVFLFGASIITWYKSQFLYL